MPPPPSPVCVRVSFCVSHPPVPPFFPPYHDHQDSGCNGKESDWCHLVLLSTHPFKGKQYLSKGKTFTLPSNSIMALGALALMHACVNPPSPPLPLHLTLILCFEFCAFIAHESRRTLSKEFLQREKEKGCRTQKIESWATVTPRVRLSRHRSYTPLIRYVSMTS